MALASPYVGFKKTSAPRDLAVSYLEGLISIAYIFPAPCNLAACMTARPTAPNPQTATVEPGVTVVLLMAAPHPVLIPQPNTQTLFKSAALLIFAAEIYAITVYSLNVEHPMKW